MDKNELKGFVYAGIAAIALANSFIFSKLSFNELDFFQFGTYWFFLGSLWNLGNVFIYNRRIANVRLNISSIKSPLIMVVILEALATGLFYYAILLMENPGVVSFIGNIGPVFVTILGLIFLKESFSVVQFFGIILAVAGIFTLNYNGYKAVSEILISGSQYVIMASFFFSIAAIIARKYHDQIDAGLLSLLRAFLLFTCFILLLAFKSNFIIPSFKTILFLSAGSFLEVFITIVFAYLSFRYIEAYKTSITISTKGIFALLSSWIFLNLEPDISQITGGILSMLGVLLVSSESEKK